MVDWLWGRQPADAYLLASQFGKLERNQKPLFKGRIRPLRAFTGIRIIIRNYKRAVQSLRRVRIVETLMPEGKDGMG